MVRPIQVSRRQLPALRQTTVDPEIDRAENKLRDAQITSQGVQQLGDAIQQFGGAVVEQREREQEEKDRDLEFSARQESALIQDNLKQTEREFIQKLGELSPDDAVNEEVVGSLRSDFNQAQTNLLDKGVRSKNPFLSKTFGGIADRSRALMNRSFQQRIREKQRGSAVQLRDVRDQKIADDTYTEESIVGGEQELAANTGNGQQELMSLEQNQARFTASINRMFGNFANQQLRTDPDRLGELVAEGFFDNRVSDKQKFEIQQQVDIRKQANALIPWSGVSTQGRLDFTDQKIKADGGFINSMEKRRTEALDMIADVEDNPVIAKLPPGQKQNLIAQATEQLRIIDATRSTIESGQMITGGEVPFNGAVGSAGMQAVDTSLRADSDVMDTIRGGDTQKIGQMMVDKMGNLRQVPPLFVETLIGMRDGGNDRGYVQIYKALTRNRVNFSAQQASPIGSGGAVGQNARQADNSNWRTLEGLYNEIGGMAEVARVDAMASAMDRGAGDAELAAMREGTQQTAEISTVREKQWITGDNGIRAKMTEIFDRISGESLALAQIPSSFADEYEATFREILQTAPLDLSFTKLQELTDKQVRASGRWHFSEAGASMWMKDGPDSEGAWVLDDMRAKNDVFEKRTGLVLPPKEDQFWVKIAPNTYELQRIDDQGRFAPVNDPTIFVERDIQGQIIDEDLFTPEEIEQGFRLPREGEEPLGRSSYKYHRDYTTSPEAINGTIRNLEGRVNSLRVDIDRSVRAQTEFRTKQRQAPRKVTLFSERIEADITLLQETQAKLKELRKQAVAFARPEKDFETKVLEHRLPGRLR